MFGVIAILCLMGAILALVVAFRPASASTSGSTSGSDDPLPPRVSAPPPSPSRNTFSPAAPPSPIGRSAPPSPIGRSAPPATTPPISRPPPRRFTFDEVPLRPIDQDATLVASTASIALPDRAIVPRYVDESALAAVNAAAPAWGGSRLRVTAAFRTARGQRERHEDVFAAVRDGTYVVADGAGGHAGGGVASRTAVSAVEAAFRDKAFGTPDFRVNVPTSANEVAGAAIKAHLGVQRRAAEEPELKGMGTTLLLFRADVAQGIVSIASVGDSRCYRLRAGELSQLTRDHVVEERVDGVIRKVLARAIGIGNPEVDVTIGSLRPGDIYLLCSDGLYRELSDDDLRAMLMKNGDLHDLAGALVDKAAALDAKDNVSVVLVGITSGSSGPSRRKEFV